MDNRIIALKWEVFRFIQPKEVIEVMYLINTFGYSYWGAMNRIKRLEKQKLIEKLSIRVGAYCLTNEACKRWGNMAKTNFQVRLLRPLGCPSVIGFSVN